MKEGNRGRWGIPGKREADLMDENYFTADFSDLKSYMSWFGWRDELRRGGTVIAELAQGTRKGEDWLRCENRV